MDHRLKWRVGRSQALTEVSGSGELADVEDGDVYMLTIDHSGNTIFAHADPPEFGDMPGIAVRLRCDGTNGQQFRVEIEILEGYGAAYGYDYGYGGGGPDVPYSWTRQGVLDGGA